MPKLTVKKRDEIRDRVDDAMRSGRWSERCARAIAKDVGVSVRQVYRYRADVEERLRAGAKKRDLVVEREEFIERLRESIRLAQKQGNHVAVVRMLALESRILGIREEQQIVHKHTGGDGSGPVGIKVDVSGCSLDQLRALAYDDDKDDQADQEGDEEEGEGDNPDDDEDGDDGGQGDNGSGDNGRTGRR